MICTRRGTRQGEEGGNVVWIRSLTGDEFIDSIDTYLQNNIGETDVEDHVRFYLKGNEAEDRR